MPASGIQPWISPVFHAILLPLHHISHACTWSSAIDLLFTYCCFYLPCLFIILKEHFLKCYISSPKTFLKNILKFYFCHRQIFFNNLKSLPNDILMVLPTSSFRLKMKLTRRCFLLCKQIIYH